MGLSQMSFAKKVHVSFSTVNRWENDHAIPNQLAVAMLIDLCEKEDVNQELVAELKRLR